MSLTSAQRATLRADILADPVFSQLPKTGDASYDIAAAYNALAAPDFLVWNPSTPVRSILDTFNWTAFTPTDTVLETDTDAALLARRTARLLAIQTKQMNLQLMLQGRDTVDASLVNFRAGLRDALINIPSGASGASVVAAGASAATALGACTRKATRAEKLFAGVPVATGTVTAAVMGFTGLILPSDVDEARAN